MAAHAGGLRPKPRGRHGRVAGQAWALNPGLACGAQPPDGRHVPTAAAPGGGSRLARQTRARRACVCVCGGVSFYLLTRCCSVMQAPSQRSTPPSRPRWPLRCLFARRTLSTWAALCEAPWPTRWTPSSWPQTRPAHSITTRSKPARAPSSMPASSPTPPFSSRCGRAPTARPTSCATLSLFLGNCTGVTPLSAALCGSAPVGKRGPRKGVAHGSALHGSGPWPRDNRGARGVASARGAHAHRPPGPRREPQRGHSHRGAAGSVARAEGVARLEKPAGDLPPAAAVLHNGPLLPLLRGQPKAKETQIDRYPSPPPPPPRQKQVFSSGSSMEHGKTSGRMGEVPMCALQGRKEKLPTAADRRTKRRGGGAGTAVQLGVARASLVLRIGWIGAAASQSVVSLSP
jgi:hypothetical protein